MVSGKVGRGSKRNRWDATAGPAPGLSLHQPAINICPSLGELGREAGKPWVVASIHREANPLLCSPPASATLPAAKSLWSHVKAGAASPWDYRDDSGLVFLCTNEENSFPVGFGISGRGQSFLLEEALEALFEGSHL